MALEPQGREPTMFLQGTKVEWRVSLPDFPSSLWDLAYQFAKTDASHTVAAASQADESFLVSLDAVATRNWVQGRYYWQALATEQADNSNVRPAGVGFTDVLGQFAKETELRSFWERVVTDLEAVIERRASRTDINYAIEGVSVASMDHAQLLAALDHARRRLRTAQNKENATLGLPVSSHVQTRMTRRGGAFSRDRRVLERLVR